MRSDCIETYSKYQGYLKLGIAREIARTILPQNIYSEAVWTASLQSVIHFLSQRMRKDAQYEIRQYANLIYNLLETELTSIGITKETLTNEEN